MKSIGIKLLGQQCQQCDDELLHELVQKLLGDFQNLKRNFSVVGPCTFIGACKPSYLNEEEIFVLQKELTFSYNYLCQTDVLCDSYEKMCTKRDLFSTITHKQSAKRQNCYVTTINDEIHQLVCFYVPRKSEGLPENHLIYSRKLKFTKVISSLNLHIVKIVEHGPLILLSPLQIKCKYIILRESPILYLSVLSNLIDRD